MTVNIIQGDVRSVMSCLPSDHFDCIVTSPPYWGLRDYGVEGQIGLEQTMQEYLDTMVDVCRDLRRVMKPEGTFWLNVGDSYAANTKGSGGAGKSTLGPNRDLQNIQFQKYAPRKFELGSLKPKDLCMVPNRLAILLQEDGWYVRSEIIWHKPNPMPESVRDRPTNAHEKVWLLTKSYKYFYDMSAIREHSVRGGFVAGGKGRKDTAFGDAYGDVHRGSLNGIVSETRNVRNVWSISPKPFKGAHFATMPPDLAERCIKAGCPEGGNVLDPFGGAGTTGLVAARLGRKATLIEINPEYKALAEARISGASDLFTGAVE